MKVTNASGLRIYLADLKFTPQAQTEGRRGEDLYLDPGAFVYLPNTSEVLRSALKGDLKRWSTQGVVVLEDTFTLAANGFPGDSIVLTHNFGLPPSVVVNKEVVGPPVTFVDATGTYNSVHNATFTTVTITNTTAGALTFFVRLM